MEPWYTKIAGLIPRKLINGAVIVAVLLVIWYFGGSDNSVDESVRDTTGEVVEAGTVGAFVLQVGDCLIMPDAFFEEEPNDYEFVDLNVVPCTELHDAQIAGEYVMEDGDYPGDEYFSNDGKFNEICWDKYDAFTKTSLDEPPHLLTLQYPTSEGWLDGDRKIQCVFFMADGGKLGASIEG
jgi:hypothetical protein